MLRPWKLEFEVNPQSGKAIYLQIADAIIEAVQTGRLKAGEPLPGSRNLSQLLKVNRNTIVEALNVLINEGWLISKERKGTFVSDVLPHLAAGRTPGDAPIGADVATVKYHITFDDGNPDSKIAPITELARAYRQIFGRKARWQMMGYGDSMGDPAFRQAISKMLNHQRGMQLSEDMICITRGSQMAMYVIAQCLMTKGDVVLIENPGYKPAWGAFESAGAKLIPVDVDRNGLIVEDMEPLLRQHKRIKAVYTTPHPPERYSFNEPVNGLRLGYGSLSNEQLEEGLKALGPLL
uniref:aminotransferase-like domain-containing protein n=1 Tax=Pedobacter schmidteae TaxID=2201271 RepID=UPI000EB4BADE|nr:PLP-dependent aminotransferase family protein [Pedobacter schmidteae]